MAIWALFSVANEHDQPENNLLRYWTRKPDFETLAQFVFGKGFTADDETTLKTVSLWKGENVVGPFSARYRLEEIDENWRG